MSTDKKYLDATGLSHLWDKITAADSVVAGSKGGFIEYKDGYVQLWASEEASKVEGATPLSKFDASAFVADSVLQDTSIVIATVDNPIYVQDENVSYTEGTFIKFEWKLADGSSKSEYLNAQKIGVVYEAGNGISLNDDTISVTSVQAGITKVTEAIPVAGGPLADLLNDAGITEISADTDMQALLFSLFCKEMWPTSTSFSDGSAKSTIAKPSFTLGNSNSTVEVGTKCALSDITIPSAAVPAVNSYPKVTGFTYGYSAADDNTQDFTGSSADATVKTAAALNSDNYQLSVDFTEFNNAVDGSATPGAIHSNVSYSGKDLIATEGTNKVKATVTGPKATVTFNSIPAYYACSNVKKTHNDKGVVYHKSDAVGEKTYTSSAASSNKELTVTAKYKYFAGHTTITDINSLDSATIRSITDLKSDWITVDDTTTVIGNTATATTANKSVMFAVPSKYKMIIPEALSGTDLATDPTTFATKPVSVKCGELDVEYTVYFAAITSGNISVKNVQIVKK